MIKTRTIEYSDDQLTYEGVVAYDESSRERRPIVMVIHTYKGQGDFENEKAIMLAQMGYVGFAIDVYGKGVRASNPDEAMELMGALNDDRSELLRRLNTSLNTARSWDQMADTSRIGAIGFCFGGKCVLDIARSGEKLSGGVSFHGIFDQPDINQDTPIKTPLLVLHGWDDPLAKPEDVVALSEELKKKGAEWELIAYGNTGHAFTNPLANSPDGGMKYSPYADKNSWKRMGDFLEEMF